MRWISSGPSIILPPMTGLALARAAEQARPNDMAVRLRLADALMKCDQFGEAGDIYAAALRESPREFSAWAKLAQCLTRLGRADEALAICLQGQTAGPAADIYSEQAEAFAQLGRRAEARTARLAALALDDDLPAVVFRMLMALARKADGGPLLALCDELPVAYGRGAVALAHRALALSKLGRTEDARQLVDIHQHVSIAHFEPPAGFGGLEAFNAEIAKAILNDPPTPTKRKEGVNIEYDQEMDRNVAFLALREFVTGQIEAYLDRFDETGLDQVMPPRPEAGMLLCANTVLRGDGANGQHIHKRGYVSSVYYVSVPETDPGDIRGSLLLGPCDRYSGGHVACWGARHIKPQPGMLVIFPSHHFHDVVPTRSQEVRISIPADLVPCKPPGVQARATTGSSRSPRNPELTRR